MVQESSETADGDAQEGAASPVMTKTHFDPLGRVQLFDFDAMKPFASFLPAVSGEYGVPMWTFYVNRGQAVTTFGTENKVNLSWMEGEVDGGLGVRERRARSGSAEDGAGGTSRMNE